MEDLNATVNSQDEKIQSLTKRVLYLDQYFVKLNLKAPSRQTRAIY